MIKNVKRFLFAHKAGFAYPPSQYRWEGGFATNDNHLNTSAPSPSKKSQSIVILNEVKNLKIFQGHFLSLNYSDNLINSNH